MHGHKQGWSDPGSCLLLCLRWGQLVPSPRALSRAGQGLLSPRHPVSVEPPPRLIAPGNITASPGQDVVLSCVVLGDAPYNLTWSWDGKAAQAGEGRARLLQNRSLEISAVRPGDAGPYQCTARSARGTATASLWLFIQGRLCPWAPPGPGGTFRCPVGGR